MHITRSRVISAAAATLLVATLAACSSDTADSTVAEDCEPRWDFDTINPGTLTVVAVNNPPSIYVNPDTGEAEGFDSEVMELFAEEACLEIDWTPLAGAAAVAAMTEGRGDLGTGGWAITEERGEVIGQFETPAYWNTGAILAADEYTSVEQLEGLTVGVEGGSVYQEPAQEALGADNVRVYQSVEAEISDLDAGRIDAVLSQAIQMGYQAEQRGMLDEYQISILPPDENYPTITGGSPSNYPFTKSNTALGDAIQEFIAELTEDGTYEEILMGYGLQRENVYGFDE